MNSNLISVIIPAFNEEDYIDKTIEGVSKWQYPTEIIVIDDGSTDNTKEKLSVIETSLNNLKVYYSNKNQGKGKALIKGVKLARGEIIAFLDADLGESAQNAVKLLYPVLKDECDMTIAIFPRSEKKAGLGLVKKLAKSGIYLLTGYKAKAPLSGQRAIKKKILEKIDWLADGYGVEVGLTIDVIRLGGRIKEIEIPLNHRETGRNIKDFVHRGKEFVDITKALLYRWR
ncbi:hypothetical protein BHF71_04900 [Vulcanibacillus modesticaldus]|uniref:Glucosyl-3-phosphoglycerate synthase n=1 Tax=Vulcanibacillus modesticaldus TaxID=337097 RepID=A0A1D2YRU2_9BACI|nr:glycosyltransferase family 2 protein [Vulcanibacillus modesticaldus]OEF95532.1 hypothetical protein BHF71_04900 [Vulcanibacillus modesticaldus]